MTTVMKIRINPHTSRFANLRCGSVKAKTREKAKEDCQPFGDTKMYKNNEKKGQDNDSCLVPSKKALEK